MTMVHTAIRIITVITIKTNVDTNIHSQNPVGRVIKDGGTKKRTHSVAM